MREKACSSLPVAAYTLRGLPPHRSKSQFSCLIFRQTKALNPVMDLPTIKVFISLVPS